MTKRFVSFGLAVSAAGLIAAVFLPHGVVSHSSDQERITVDASERGYPRINLRYGIELGDNVSSPGVSARAMAAGDFDSDGTADLFTVDDNGAIQFFKGNVRSIYPEHAVGPDQAPAAGNESPFFRASSGSLIPSVPDRIEAGDFNADGRLDILAARYGDSSIFLMAGNGAGGFAEPFEIKVSGLITALSVGEIGQADGQTDAAVAVTSDGISSLLVFEHPAGAFAHPPESLPIPGPAYSIALGHLDIDHFADIAAASDSSITVVHGRGQAYPWDSIAEYEIKRPAPGEQLDNGFRPLPDRPPEGTAGHVVRLSRLFRSRISEPTCPFIA